MISVTTWTLASDTSGASFSHSGGGLHYAVRVDSGSGTLKMQVSYDNGSNWEDLTGATQTATGQKNLNFIPPGTLIRPNLSGSASTPSFVVRAYSIRPVA